MAALLLAAGVLVALVQGLRYDPAFADYNLNQNQQAINPLDFSGDRGKGFAYWESPKDWRMPTYTLFLDRYANGDPSNDNANETVFEQDITSNQLRHGGDLQGLIDSLDYIQGMGIKVIYIAGSPFINLPWGVDSYSPLDLTLLDKHFGDIKQWQATVDEIHSRGMYVILDHTFSTMGDLLAFDGFENITAPFDIGEHKVHYKSNRQYLDFQISNNYLPKCDYPRFWLETGLPVGTDVTDQLKGCFDSDFDHYGDIEAFGVHPDWQRSLAKFASVQDRLRDWKPSVRERLEVFSCLTISMLDIDGFRFDKATQITIDALADHNAAVRTCAAKYNKKNFFLPGEITGGNNYGSIYIGRGRQQDQYPADPNPVMNFTTDNAGSKFFIRDKGKNALDAAAFHYSVYRFLTRFVGLSGNLEAGFDLPPNWVGMWSQMIGTNDLINANTGVFDPRHQLGTTNQDVFRWPAITQGTERMLLGMFITTLHMPGAPLVYYGEEQEFYILDSTAENYIFGRQAMSATPAWMLHGCHLTNSTQYIGWPVSEKSRNGCRDETVSYDHRDPSHPVRNIMKAMYTMRENFPSLQDGWLLQTLSNKTDFTIIDGKDGEAATERGIWSIARATFPTVQGPLATNPVWFVYHNRDSQTDYTFKCADGDDGFIAPFTAKTKVRNLFYPYDEIDLVASPSKPLGFNGSTKANGCTDKITMKPFEFRAYVESSMWKGPQPMITKFTPGHDAPVKSDDIKGSLDITIEFSEEMDCDSVTKAITIGSTTEDNSVPKVGTPKCTKLNSEEVAPFVGAIASNFRWAATLTNVADGVHRITVTNATNKAGTQTTRAVDHFLVRVGAPNNPIAWPLAANYSKTLVTKEGSDLFVNHAAAGADKWRYSTNWGSTYSAWADYKGGKEKIDNLPWSGTDRQAWSGDHVIVQYWSKWIGSSSFRQEGDSDPNQKERRFPHIFAHGLFNKFGFDGGLKNTLDLKDDGKWELHFMDEWPTQFQLNIWGMNPDGKPDASFVYGDVDMDNVLDRMPPSSLAKNILNISSPPTLPALSYRVLLDDRTLTFSLEPQGNIWIQIIMFILLAVLPVLGGLFAVWIFMGSFYKVKLNKVGFKKRGRSPFRSAANRLSSISFEALRHKGDDIELAAVPGKRRKVIIATIEYNIDDWNIKIKIGGLGVMAQLMGKALEHQDLIWVVPCVGGIEYPIDQRAEPMYAPIMGKEYEIEVQYHQVKNITYVLLDAPIFRQQSKSDPYPPRMDDIDSAIYYSAWNYCIAEAIRRFNPDLYHINDYHGAAAALYLLPRTIPCALSLHNAEFQGMWPMRNPEESKEVCEVFNLDPEIVKEYVQFGSVFNLLHAGSSYLRVHQKGFGAVGVSKKYGDRSYARYPIFWGLSKIGQLPNPDPSDTASWSRDEENKNEGITIDQDAESKRGELRKQAQEWAGLEVNPNAELFVFVGRWSLQKGVDLIADIFPSILDKYPSTQLICVGPVIDLYGKFAALKLAKLMEKYPKRVYSKPEFTALPPYIFSGAEFALIPSRDEPFGLVAVEFGRKGALGVGARVGGLGQMPGWWYTIESTASQHLLHQFREAIVSALESKPKTRVKMRAWSAKQRFPVAQWVEDLDKLQGECIRIHNKEAKKHRKLPGSNSAARLTIPSEIDLHGQNRRSFVDDSDLESRSGSPTRSRASSIAIPYISEPAGDSAQNRRSVSNPLGSPGTPPVGGEVADPFLPPNPMFSNQSARSSVSSFQTLGPNDPGNRASVDTFAFRMMSADPSEAAPRSFGLYNPQARPGASQMYQNRGAASSRLSVMDVVGERHDFKLQNVDPFFTDSTGDYYKEFEQKLSGLTPKNSDSDLCIDDFLKQSEKEWFKEFRNAKLGRSRSPSRTREGAGQNLLVKKNNRNSSRVASMVSVNSLAPSEDDYYDNHEERNPEDRDDEFLLGTGYKPPKGLKKLLQIRVGDWPVYSFIIALGQIVAGNSYQIVLLAGESGQTATQLYIVAGTYAVTSILWWLLFRRLTAHYVLSLPWFFYGLGFLLLGVTPFLPAGMRGAIQDAATASYATGASSGALFFALNFGDEGGAPIMVWIFRAAVIQGIQQFYIVGLWYWGSLITSGNPIGSFTGGLINGTVPTVMVITVPVAVVMWLLGIVSFIGLPDYYRQSPDKIPSFYASLIRRRIVPMFFVTVIIQNFFLSAPYGRNWEFLFYSRAIPQWSVLLLAFAFFGILWCLALWLFSFFSKTHPWIVPLFAIGLGAPRWAQMLWGISGIGLYLPWVGTSVASAILTRCLWLWLGLLDTIQGVGLGMVLLLTLTRQHVAATLIGAQTLGAAFTILARAVGPDKEGPGDVFPDFSEGVMPGFSKPWFWIALALQLILPIGFFKFFRKEQVAKP